MSATSARSTRTAALPVLLLVAVTVVGCSDDPPQRPVASASSASSPASSAAATVPPAAPSPARSTAPPAPSPVSSPAPSAGSSFAGDTRPDTEEPGGAPLTVTAVRVARQAGFDRVVFELAGGDGAPGWRVQYDDTPTRDGSGQAVAVRGATTLAVVLTGIGYPFDTGVTEVTGNPALPGDLAVVRDVVVGSTFEGQFEAFIGVTGERPFTVRRLTGPARVVVDVAHG